MTAAGAGDMKVYTLVEVDRNEFPDRVELDMPLTGKHRLFAFIRSELQDARYQSLGPEFVGALLRSLRGNGCDLQRFDNMAMISLYIPDDYEAPAGLKFDRRLAWPIIFADPATFSCSWDLITGHLIYNASEK